MTTNNTVHYVSITPDSIKITTQRDCSPPDAMSVYKHADLCSAMYQAVEIQREDKYVEGQEHRPLDLTDYSRAEIDETRGD